MEPFAIEAFGGGFIVADYTGSRGAMGAAYADKDGRWVSQPIGLHNPFPTEAEARTWAEAQSYEMPNG